MTKYMHTLNSKPAYFDGTQVVYFTRYGRAIPLVSSLKEIRKHQVKSFNYRLGKGYDDCGDTSYVRVAT